ncbi:hypothetical protein [Krasilnikoviella flava]|uniref:Uncharacterized protein n=1 Tax=Krasilnikoviella flava TaxID=526729 RepID=A0A1T5LFJ4_9MICO|nr:hypothetical protein [Krasilnikoviella flava]SKC74624.1 hypothetical protein SAMN04324258_3311 [Krasilnikoviella flava]
MDELEQQPGATGGAGHDARPRAWNGDDARLAQFSGVLGEVHDPLTWGLDLEDEALTGHSDSEDPTCERFVRAYRSFTGEALEVETLRTRVPDDDVEDVVRAACSGALAAPLHADIAAPVEPDGDGGHDGGSPDFADSFQDYRSAMRALVAEVDKAPLRTGTFAVDGDDAECVRVTARDTTAVYVAAVDRALVVTGPADLVDRVEVVTRHVDALLSGPGRSDGAEDAPPPTDT